MKYVFVGDIHGKAEEVEKALSMEGTIIFVGDFIDSFKRSLEDHEKCYDLVISAIRSGKAQAIYGNHELSYIPVCGEYHTPIHRCSGYMYSHQKLMDKYKDDVKELFKPYIFLFPNILISHAGLTKQIWDTVEKKFGLTDIPVILDSWWPHRGSPMHYIGTYRGGRDRVGGMFWCDFNQEFEPIKGLVQIFGHTAGKGIRGEDESFCIDCLDYSPNTFLEMEI